MAAASSSSNFEGPRVFINFRGADMREFASHLHAALRVIGINACMDSDLPLGEELTNLFKRIEDSQIALAIISNKYTESKWCLNELVKMIECKNLLIIPVFYKVKASTVSRLEGTFGDNLLNLWRNLGCNRGDWIVKWDGALQDVQRKKALMFKDSDSDEDAFKTNIVHHVRNALDRITQSISNPTSFSISNSILEQNLVHSHSILHSKME